MTRNCNASVSPEARATCLRIRQDADRYTDRALRRIALLARDRSLLEQYEAGAFGWWWKNNRRRP